MKQTTGERIKALRTGKGLSQQALADCIYVSQPAVAAYETDTNKPDTATLITLAQLFEVSTDYLLCVVDERTPITKIRLNELTEAEEAIIKLIRTYPENVRQSIASIVSHLGSQNQ